MSNVNFGSRAHSPTRGASQAYRDMILDCHFPAGEFEALQGVVKLAGQQGEWHSYKNVRIFAPMDQARMLYWNYDTGNIGVQMSGNYVRRLGGGQFSIGRNTPHRSKRPRCLKQRIARDANWRARGDQLIAEACREFLVSFFGARDGREICSLMGKLSGIKASRTEDGDVRVMHWFGPGGEYLGFELRKDESNDEDVDNGNGSDSNEKRSGAWVVIDQHIDLTIPLRITLDKLFSFKDFGDASVKLQRGMDSLVAESENLGKPGLTSEGLGAFFRDKDNFLQEAIDHYSGFARVTMS